MQWEWKYLILILISSSVDYFCAKKIYTSINKKLYLGISIFTNLGILFVFKYYNFFLESFITLFGIYNESSLLYINLLLPIGISFYTFQTLSYSIDVYFNRMKPVNNIINFFLYVSFFPQLVAGPIERANYLINQIKKEKIINTKIMDMGVSLILVGLFKKIVIADNLAYYVDDIFANYQNYDGGVLILGLVYFSFQIYCDFSGYSDIAIGTARLFGIELNLNFKFPYHSKNISEFWKRWHISLSTWFRDYVYIPLGGSKNSRLNTYRNLLIVFTLSGLWHGANLTFIFWGLYHVILYYIWIIMKLRFKFNSKIFDLMSIIYTYITVTIGWVFFRSETINDAFNYLKLSIIKLNFPGELRSALVYVLMIIILDIILRNSPKDILRNFPLSKRLLFNTIIFILIILFYTEGGNFIYFRF
tara:strand:- start:1327 stop:2580 length:1254 start_codon:yes stop_codon:yes gene_type:complete